VVVGGEDAGGVQTQTQGRHQESDNHNNNNNKGQGGYVRPGGVGDQSWISAGGYDSQEDSLEGTRLGYVTGGGSLSGIGSPVKKDGSIDSLTKLASPTGMMFALQFQTTITDTDTTTTTTPIHFQ
jgi:hypothetical protein